MKAIWIAGLLSFALWAEGTEDSRVLVCLSAGSVSANMALIRAKAIAVKMFAGIGVTLGWRGSTGCPADAIRITFSEKTPREQLPGAFAYALPYEGSHIVVFYDRVSNEIAEPRRLPSLLAYVLVHEITHMLVGANHHSAAGIMKPHWDERDYEEMVSDPLKFTSQDVTLIHDGLTRRRSIHPSQPETTGR